jgi:hypothetical protein
MPFVFTEGFLADLWMRFAFYSLIVRYGRRTILNNPNAAGRKDLRLLRALKEGTNSLHESFANCLVVFPPTVAFADGGERARA